MKNELIKLNGMEIMYVDFNGDSLLVVKLKDTNKVYVGLSFLFDVFDFDKNDRDIEIRKIKSDIVVSKGATMMSLPTKGGNQKAWTLELDYLALWLAKITVDNKRKQRSPETMEKLIEYQLRAKDVLSSAFLGKSKEWDLHREVGKIDRKRMTSSIETNIFNAQPRTYADYTNMVYGVLLNMTAKEIRESRKIEKKSQLTRDYLTKEELNLVDEAETIVTALISLGFKKDYILDQLRRKFTKQIA